MIKHLEQLLNNYAANSTTLTTDHSWQLNTDKETLVASREAPSHTSLSLYVETNIQSLRTCVDLVKC